MNRVFKTKYIPTLGAWAVCSELAKNRGKVGSIKTGCSICLYLVSQCAYSDADWNGQLFRNSNEVTQFLSQSTPNTYNAIVDPNKKYSTTSILTNHSLNNNPTINYLGNLNAVGGEGLVSSSTKNTINFEGKVSFIASNNKTSGTRASGLVNGKKSTINFKDNITLNSVYKYTGMNSSFNAYNNGVVSSDNSKIYFKNLNITLEDQSKGGFLGLLLTTGNFGIRVDQGSNGYVHISDLLDVKIDADRAIGAYVSGYSKTDNNAGLVLNNSNFVLSKDSQSSQAFTGEWDSYGLKLGKVRSGSQGAGIIESLGGMSIDTTNVLYGGGIKMMRNSKIYADKETSSTTIKTSGYALEIGTPDDQNSGFQFEHGASHNIEAYFKNASFSTLGTSIDPRIIYSINKNAEPLGHG